VKLVADIEIRKPVLSRNPSPAFSHEFDMEPGKGCRARAIWPLMLPVTLQFIIAMIATAINDRLQRRLDYVEAA
jgi:hypothetical protein